VDRESWITECRRLLADGRSLEDAIAFLRKDGASYFDSISVLMELKGISLKDATMLVFKSETWADERPKILESQHARDPMPSCRGERLTSAAKLLDNERAS